ncbi:hypothetical protein T07_1313 [Trichinella nelsoni]|uniref:Uncharacterized protein n=1 Tax=Trichinella nelsoni TaxID=6336 RepID=A0A0V0RHK6_9BILA|nr:hypothetical protein T07_1313 [Trichinella nelsoni]
MISGKGAAVEPSVIYTWKSKVMNVVADETGLYFEQLPKNLNSVHWISQSWNHVDVEVIIKCFQLAGISSAEDSII